MFAPGHDQANRDSFRAEPEDGAPDLVASPSADMKRSTAPKLKLIP